MTVQSRFNPADMASMWDMNQQSLGKAETAMRAWFELSSRVREEATEFMNSRLSKDSAALAELGQCKTPVEALDVQVSYFTRAYTDYVNEGQKIIGYFADVAREGMPGVSDESAPSTRSQSKRTPHRAAY